MNSVKWFLVGILFSLSLIGNTTALAETQGSRLDQLTSKALHSIGTGDWTKALNSASALVNEYPDYAVGHWLVAETHNVMAMNEPLLQSTPNYSSSLVELLLEAQARAQQTQHSARQNTSEQYPSEMLQIGKHIDNVILVDLHTSMLYQFDTKNETPLLQKKHYISSGKAGFGKLREGDLKTPLGVYQIHGFRSDKSLPPLYGSGALMLNYPNVLDRALGRTGSGIWLHGNPPHDKSRSPRSSEGCVTMANEHLLDLYGDINIDRTHVILSHKIQWQAWSSNDSPRERYQELFEQYRAAWVDSQVDDLFSLYANDALPDHVRHVGSPNTQKVSTAPNKVTGLAPRGIALNELSGVSSEDISILHNPTLDQEPNQQYLIMSFKLPGNSQARVTLYWERHANTGYWQIKREAISADEA